MKDIVQTNNLTLKVSASEWSLKQILVSLESPEYILICKIEKFAEVTPVANAWAD